MLDDCQSLPRFRLRSIFVLTAVVAAGLTAYRFWPIDGFSVGTRARTIFADGYSDAGWRAVGLGTTRRDVYARLGQPKVVTHFADSRTLEEWTVTGGIRPPGIYRRRALGFKGDAVVFKKAGIARQRPSLNVVYPASRPFE
jgi:hypothetical protein